MNPATLQHTPLQHSQPFEGEKFRTEGENNHTRSNDSQKCNIDSEQEIGHSTNSPQ